MQRVHTERSVLYTQRATQFMCALMVLQDLIGTEASNPVLLREEHWHKYIYIYVYLYIFIHIYIFININSGS